MKTLGIVGWKNSGKTGLIVRLLRNISLRGLSVSTIKHTHHSVDIDKKGKDSFEHRAAGAREVILCSDMRWALMHEVRGGQQPSLNDLITKLSPVDLVLIEGFKKGNNIKLEVFRHETGKSPLAESRDDIVAIASNKDHNNLTIPVFNLDDTNTIVDFVLETVGLS